MDPAHHDRVAFYGLPQGVPKGLKVRHVRAGRDVQIHNAITFMASRREAAEVAVAGDIVRYITTGRFKLGIPLLWVKT